MTPCAHRVLPTPLDGHIHPGTVDPRNLRALDESLALEGVMARSNGMLAACLLAALTLATPHSATRGVVPVIVEALVTVPATSNSTANTPRRCGR